MDFDDIIFNTVRLLEGNPDVLELYQKQFKYVMVDEYQDTSHAQYILVSLLAGGYNNICVVGDDDQSIYRFRGATIENILSFEINIRTPVLSGWSRIIAQLKIFLMLQMPLSQTIKTARAKICGLRRAAAKKLFSTLLRTRRPKQAL